MTRVDKIVIVTKKTWLEELIERFNTKSQAKFYIEHMGGSFEDYEDAHKQYYLSLDNLKKLIPLDIKTQIIEKSFLPNFLFGPNNLIIVIGQDGLVINTAKYLEKQLIIAVNPDPKRFDGIMIPFKVEEVPKIIRKILDEEFSVKQVSMAVARLNNGQFLYGVNDLFIGHKSHGSARYNITCREVSEKHSSSGIIVSTGAGSTAWFRSIVTGAIGIVNKFRKYNVRIDPPREEEYRFPWDANYLYFAVREPFVSKTSEANIVFDQIFQSEELVIESNMPENGVIFSDGIQEDYLEFNSGTIAKISVAKKKVQLVVK
ncbi:MAG TPA: sugar kinase [candidate division Zixibacteria bacterium]|nr:sugar kinase [candidate division Zixibacteria bacterium]